MQYKRLTPHFVHLDSVDSTNNYAANLLRETKTESGTTVLTKRQTAGRGQRGNTWQAEPGLNLTFSVIVYPDLLVNQVFYLNSIVSLALANALQQFTTDITIKWPNDIFAGEQKIAGILVENQFRGEQVVSSILGVGINVNQKYFESPVIATSLRLLEGVDFSTEDVFHEFYKQLDFYFNLLQEQQFKLLSKLYHEHLMGMDQLRRFSDANGPFEAIIKGVDEDGKLKLHRSEGIRKYDLKEVRFLF